MFAARTDSNLSAEIKKTTFMKNLSPSWATHLLPRLETLPCGRGLASLPSASAKALTFDNFYTQQTDIDDTRVALTPGENVDYSTRITLLYDTAIVQKGIENYISFTPAMPFYTTSEAYGKGVEITCSNKVPGQTYTLTIAPGVQGADNGVNGVIDMDNTQHVIQFTTANPPPPVSPSASTPDQPYR